MTLSPDVRRAEQATVLSAALSKVGDGFLESVILKAGEDAPDVHPMTWTDLAEKRLLKSLGEIGGVRYFLTATGWLEAHRLSGAAQSEDTRNRLKKLMAFFKGEADKAFMSDPQVQRVAIDSQYGQIHSLSIPPGWIYNAVVSGLLAEAFPKDNVNVSYHNRLYRVPVNFGRKRID